MVLEDDIREIDRLGTFIPKAALKTFEDAVELSDVEFAEYYHALMRTYRVTHMWWRGVVPLCAGCDQEIVRSDDLRMYDRGPYHPSCFAEVCEPGEGLMGRYWRKVLDLE